MGRKSPKTARKFFPHLQVLAQEAGNTKRRKAMLQSADPQLIKTIAECCYNGLYNTNIQLPETVRKKLRIHKRTIVKVADKKFPIEKKRKTLVQSGGWYFSRSFFLCRCLNKAFSQVFWLLYYQRYLECLVVVYLNKWTLETVLQSLIRYHPQTLHVM